MSKCNVVVMVSGNGSNLQAIIDACKNGKINASVKAVISDQKDAFALSRAQKAGIKAVFVDPKAFKTREEHEKAVSKIIDEEKAGLVVMAGYMRLVTKYFIEKYRGRLINIHPSLLPSFKGTHGQQDAFDFGVKIAGCTVHFVEVDMDAGPIIKQAAVPVKEDDTAETLKKRILEQEHIILPEAIGLFADGKLKLNGKKVSIH